MSEWRDTNLGEVIEVKYGKDHKHLATGKIPAYGSGGVMRYVDTALYDDESILIPRKGSLNNIIYESKPFWTVDTMFWSKIDKTLAHPKFLFYQLTEIDYMNLNVGSAVPSLTVPVINAIEISLPPLEEQKAIASVLSSLDDKINLLQRQNTTLERMAETLFRQWFVEEAQEDWEEYKVLDFAQHLKQGVNPAQNPYVEFHHYSLPSFDESQRPVVELGSEILSNKYRVLENTILVSKLNPRFPRIWAIQYLPSANSVCSTEFQVFKPKQDNLYAYLYFLFGSSQARDALEMAASGTSGSHQRVRPEDMLNISTQLPSIGKAIEFSEITQPYVDKITANRKQIQTLEKLRDNLLPKLMSGEVRVKI